MIFKGETSEKYLVTCERNDGEGLIDFLVEIDSNTDELIKKTVVCEPLDTVQ